MKHNHYHGDFEDMEFLDDVPMKCICGSCNKTATQNGMCDEHKEELLKIRKYLELISDDAFDFLKYHFNEVTDGLHTEG